MNSISLVVIGLFKLYLSCWVSYGNLCFSGNWCFSSKLSNSGVDLFTVFPYYPLDVCRVGSGKTYCIFYISNLAFSLSVLPELVNSIDLFKAPTF